MNAPDGSVLILRTGGCAERLGEQFDVGLSQLTAATAEPSRGFGT
jgi:hypothetical protein